ncbi:neural cell adhesion molecule 1 [Elysia marginata]|uniref:Neural cell adhesion molecule 1 n=1 Tax=Elysia marginata TaxID=1093978 RepID=A0AAV4IDT8_9GAST|nr:neural cell adhesion molecule 1 [Elysia marginata]
MKRETALLFFIIVEPACGPVEEGQSTALTCDINTAGCSGPYVARWLAEEAGSTQMVLCNSKLCGGLYSSDFPTTISSTRSRLSISNASRVSPFNMETKWTCNPCNRGFRTVCDKLQIFGFPQVFHSCTTNVAQGYFIGKSARCTCRATSDGYPRGSAQWYKGDQTVGSNGDLDITYNKNNLEPLYTCEAKSPLGRKPGSTVRAKFAFVDPDSVQISSSSSEVNLCDNNNQVQVICEISRDHVSPAPTFSLSVNRPRPQGPQPGTNSGDGNYYQSRFSFSPDVGGQYQVTCRVTNSVTTTWQHKSTQIKFNSPPQVTVGGQTYQGIIPSNIVTLAEGYTGDVTCRVEGGYPGAHTTQLKCGQLDNTGDGNTATVRFTTDTLTRDLDGTVCICTSQHDSGCYSNKETRFKLNVLYALEVTFTKSSPSTEFNKGDNLDLTCSAQGHPDPTSVTLTKERNDDIITRVQAAELTHTLDSLDCLDTGVYVCSGQNSQGTTSEEISIGVNCAQQFSPWLALSPYIDGVIGEKAEIDIEIYGFPEPRVTLLRTVDNANLKSFPRHEVKYTSTVAPFGFVKVTIFDLMQADYTNYTLTIDNGVGDALTYSFYLNQVKTRPRPEAGGRDTDTESDSFNSTALIIGLIAVVVLVTCVVIFVFLVRKIQDLKRRQDNCKENAGIYIVPVERPDIVNTLQTTETPRLGHYEDIDITRYTTHAPPVSTSSPPQSRQDQNITETSADTHTTLVSASQPSGKAQYETILDMVQQSGLYNSTSPQDVEPPNIYRRAKPDTSSNTDLALSGPYNNYAPGDHGQTPDTSPRSQPTETTVTSLPVKNYVNVELPSVGNTSNKKPHQQAYENVDMS